MARVVGGKPLFRQGTKDSAVVVEIGPDNTPIYEGTNHIQCMVIARQLLK